MLAAGGTFARSTNRKRSSASLSLFSSSASLCFARERSRSCSHLCLTEGEGLSVDDEADGAAVVLGAGAGFVVDGVGVGVGEGEPRIGRGEAKRGMLAAAGEGGPAAASLSSGTAGGTDRAAVEEVGGNAPGRASPSSGVRGYGEAAVVEDDEESEEIAEPEPAALAPPAESEAVWLCCDASRWSEGEGEGVADLTSLIGVDWTSSAPVADSSLEAPWSMKVGSAA